MQGQTVGVGLGEFVFVAVGVAIVLVGVGVTGEGVTVGVGVGVRQLQNGKHISPFASVTQLELQIVSQQLGLILQTQSSQGILLHPGIPFGTQQLPGTPVVVGDGLGRLVGVSVIVGVGVKPVIVGVGANPQPPGAIVGPTGAASSALNPRVPTLLPGEVDKKL